MAFLDDLKYGAISAKHGILYGAGYDDGLVYFEWSDDNGKTKKTLQGGVTRQAISTSDETQPAIVISITGEIIVTVNSGSAIYTYISKDSGHSWDLISTI